MNKLYYCYCSNSIPSLCFGVYRRTRQGLLLCLVLFGSGFSPLPDLPPQPTGRPCERHYTIREHVYILCAKWIKALCSFPLLSWVSIQENDNSNNYSSQAGKYWRWNCTKERILLCRLTDHAFARWSRGTAKAQSSACHRRKGTSLAQKQHCVYEQRRGSLLLLPTIEHAFHHCDFVIATESFYSRRQKAHWDCRRTQLDRWRVWAAVCGCRNHDAGKQEKWEEKRQFSFAPA